MYQEEENKEEKIVLQLLLITTNCLQISMHPQNFICYRKKTER